MSTGIVVHQSATAPSADRDLRLDHAGFVGFVDAARAPDGVRPGDVVALPVLHDIAALTDHPAARLLDATTRRSVRAFFDNGGDRCTVFAVCVGSVAELVDPERADALLQPLLDRLQHDEDVSLLLAPALAWLPIVGRRAGGHAFAVALLGHCRQSGDRLLLLDAPIDAEEHEVAAWIERLRAEPGVDPSYGALYFPWCHQQGVLVPPSGAVAGAHAALMLGGTIQGLRRAPANIGLTGFTHPRVELGWADASALVEAGINPIVVQPSRGLVLAGARTLSDDPRWRSILARRIVSYVTGRVRRDADWVVFEHLRPELYDAVARTIRARLDELWRAGLLTGRAAGDEYRVRCDEEDNPASVRARGEVHVRILLRPVSATEFVDIELQLTA